MDDLMDIKEKLSFIKNYIDFIGSESKSNEKNYSDSLVRLEFLQKEIQRANDMELLTRKVSEYYSEKYLKQLESFITKGLSEVFDDRVYKLEIEVSDKKVGKEVKFWLIENHTLRSDMNSIGSGVKCVISFLIQVFIIEKMKGGKYLFLDESFTEISQEYIDNLFRMIKNIIEKLNFNILLISHLDEHKRYFDSMYEVSNGTINKIK